MKKTKTKKIKQKKLKKQIPAIRLRRVLLMFSTVGMLLLSIGLFLLYGTWPWFRETLITTAMTTMRHQYLAKWFYNDDTINSILSKNVMIEPEDDTDPEQIDVGNEIECVDEFDCEILDREKGQVYKLMHISGPRYQGYLIAIYEPSKVKIANTQYIGSTGQYLTTIAANNNAAVAINAGGFYDPDWNSNGGVPHGNVIKDGKLLWSFAPAGVGGGFVGFDNNDRLILGRMSAQQALNMGMRDAIEFGPFLIVNGEAAFAKGDGGWGIAPRTAIGQRKDGIVLFLIVDGRSIQSVGADMVDMTEVMQRYHAYNAANMDGGSSTALVINNQIVNNPVAAGPNGLRAIPNAWIVEN